MAIFQAFLSFERCNSNTDSNFEKTALKSLIHVSDVIHAKNEGHRSNILGALLNRNLYTFCVFSRFWPFFGQNDPRLENGYHSNQNFSAKKCPSPNLNQKTSSEPGSGGPPARPIFTNSKTGQFVFLGLLYYII